MRSPLPSSVTRPRRIRRPTLKMLENAEMQLRHGGSPGTSKRRRGLLGRRQPRKTTRVEVVVPTLRQVRSDARVKREGDTRSMPAAAAGEHASQAQPPPSPRIKSEESVDAKMYFLLQATIKVEVKPEAVISQNVVRDRLARIGYETLDLGVPHDILDATATREFTSRIWGGSMQATFPKIGRHFTHGLDDFMYINLLYDPHAPRWPGSPGLLFRFRDDGQEWPKIMRVVVRLRDNAWQYMGQYKLTAAPPLAPEEWNAQSIKVKQKWANKLSRRKSDGGLKAKIVLWKRLGREPTPQEVAAVLQSNKRFYANADEILRACDEGRAVVRVWCIECVGYDVDFQRKIAAGS